MKTKLLKKIRKRFEWRKSGKRNWHIVDKKEEKAIFIDKRNLPEKKPPCGKKEYLFRCFKVELLKPFIHDPIKKIMYKSLKAAIRKHKNKRNESKKTTKESKNYIREKA